MLVTPRTFISAKQIRVPAPWDAILVPVSAFPIPDEQLPSVARFIAGFSSRTANGRHLNAETFIQVEQSDDRNYRQIYAEGAPRWIPEVGLGVWPDREPPSTWTKEEFMNSGPGKKLRTLMHQVLRITASPEARSEAFEAMLPFGPLLQIMTADGGEAFLSKATALLLRPIKDPSFTCYPFYVPLFEEKTLTSAASEQLDLWFCGASIYIRESFEDRGILIASHTPLSPILEQLGGRLEQQPEPTWRIPC